MRIGLFIIPNKYIEEEVENWKKWVANEFGNKHPYLSHPVHLTLFTQEIKSSKVPDVVKKISDILVLQNAFSAAISKPLVFADDPLTGGHTLCFELKKNYELFKLQKALLKAFDGLRNANLEVGPLGLSIEQSKNFYEYGFPFVGNSWIPHITVASVINCSENDVRINFFLEKFKNMELVIDKISLWEIEGDNHEMLHEWSL